MSRDNVTGRTYGMGGTREDFPLLCENRLRRVHAPSCHIEHSSNAHPAFLPSVPLSLAEVADNEPLGASPGLVASPQAAPGASARRLTMSQQAMLKSAVSFAARKKERA